MQLKMDDTNVEWLDKKSHINHMFKGFDPIDILFPQLTSLNPIFGPKIPKETSFLERKSPFLNVI
jgi:hypothetical protein